MPTVRFIHSTKYCPGSSELQLCWKQVVYIWQWSTFLSCCSPVLITNSPFPMQVGSTNKAKCSVWWLHLLCSAAYAQEALTHLTSPQLPVWPLTRSFYYKHCNWSAVGLVFPTKEQGHYCQRLSENPYSRNDPDLYKFWTGYKRTTSCFHKVQHVTAQNHHSPHNWHQKRVHVLHKGKIKTCSLFPGIIWEK